MPRQPDGTYVLPPSNPVVPLTVIDTDWANPTMEDFAVQFNNVLTRDGKLGYTASAKFISGTVGAPGYHFGNDTASGMYAGAGFIGMSYAGVERWRVSATGTKINGAVEVEGINLNAPGLIAGAATFQAYTGNTRITVRPATDGSRSADMVLWNAASGNSSYLLTYADETTVGIISGGAGAPLNRWFFPGKPVYHIIIVKAKNGAVSYDVVKVED